MTDPSPGESLARRTLLRGAGILSLGAAGAAALGGCGASATGGNGVSGAGGPPQGAAPGLPQGGATTAPGAGGEVSLPTADVPVGGGVIVTSRLVVVTQPVAGEFKAFSAICTHQQCPVTQVSGGKIVCPCHGSRFDIATGAPTPESPAKLPLEPKTVTVSGATVTVA